MPNYKVTDAQLTSVADAIRSKSGSSDALVFPTGFVNKVNGMSAKLNMTSTSSNVTTRSLTSVPAKNVVALPTDYPGIGRGDSQIVSFSMTPQPSGYANLKVFAEVVSGQYKFYVWNTGTGSVTIPRNTKITYTYYKYSASL